MVAILMDIPTFADGTDTKNAGHRRNPQRHVFLNAPRNEPPKDPNEPPRPGIGSDLVYRDPWGNPYIISLDMDFDDFTGDGVYSILRKGKLTATPKLSPILPTKIFVWSFGPDGKADKSPTTGINNNGKGLGANKDNILSWDL